MSKKKTAAKKKPKSQHPGSTPMVSIPSPQSMEGVLSNILGMGRIGGNAVDEAQDIIYKAWDAPTPEHAVALARKALTISPDCADAYNLLAQEAAESLEEAIDLFRKGVEAGERALGKKAFKDKAGDFWGYLETRPYMRARAGMAECLWEAGQREDAVEHYWEMLRLNPNDNQGMRDSLMPCLIELGRDEDAERLFKQYADDGMAVWMYSRALLDFRKYGASPATDESLKAALKENRHVPSYLLGRTKPPRTLPDHYGFGDDNEAILYASGNMAAWKATPGAMEWLAAKAK